MLVERTLPGGARLVVRPAGEDDAEALVAYLNEAGGETPFLGFGGGGFDRTVEEERAFLAAVRASDNSLFVLAEVDGRLVGAANVSGGARERMRHAGELGISLLRAYWGDGIGRDLMRALLDWARAGGVLRKLNLQVRADNVRAIAFYERLGFVHEGRVSRGVRVDGEFHDLLHMGIEIDPDPHDEGRSEQGDSGDG